MFKDDSLISKDNKVSNSKKVILKTLYFPSEKLKPS